MITSVWREDSWRVSANGWWKYCTVSDDGCATGDYAENHWIVHFKTWILSFVFLISKKLSFKKTVIK